MRGTGLLAAGDAVGAVPLLARAVSEQPGNARVHYSYASALFLSGSREEAIGSYQTAAQLAPRTAVYRADLARALQALGRTGDAVAEFEAAVAISPRDQVLLREFAQALNDVGQTERATTILRRVANEDGNLTAQRQLAQSLERSGDLDGAEQAYRGVLESLPLEHISRGRLAEVLMRQERAEEAVTVLEEGIALDPAAAILQRNLGSIQERVGNFREAAAAYREYARLAPGEPDSSDIEQRAAALEARVQQAEGGQ
jgi:tetratricopeptide (TPR) repeat protein